MDSDSLKKKYLNRDRVVRVIDKMGYFRAALIRNTNTAREVKQCHNLSFIPSFFLSKTLASASLLASFLKGEERIIVDIDSDGLITKLYAEAMQVGEVRGFARFDPSINQVKFARLENALGQGFLKVSRILYNKSTPVSGVIPIQVGDIGGDLAHYFAQSEQIPSAVILDVDFDSYGNILHSGGLLVQALPGAPPDVIHDIYNKMTNIKKAGLFWDSQDFETILEQKIPFKFNIVKSSQVDLFCRCSKDKFLSKLLTLGIDEINSMQKDEHNELICQYCNKKYIIEKADYDWLRHVLLTKTN